MRKLWQSMEKIWTNIGRSWVHGECHRKVWLWSRMGMFDTQTANFRKLLAAPSRGIKTLKCEPQATNLAEWTNQSFKTFVKFKSQFNQANQPIQKNPSSNHPLPLAPLETTESSIPPGASKPSFCRQVCKIWWLRAATCRSRHHGFEGEDLEDLGPKTSRWLSEIHENVTLTLIGTPWKYLPVIKHSNGRYTIYRYF